jgi:peptidoglycan hydrolase-like protein with peptidoglycan-binding domain
VYPRGPCRLLIDEDGGQETDMTTTSIASWPVVAQPMQGPAVEALQHLLRHHGQNIAADGQFGPKTAAAVKAFQQSKGLAADGKAGPQTWPAVIITVRKGSQGEAVRGAQCLLVDTTVDGIFGPKTDAAVRQMQGHLGVTVDGIVGPMTWRALVNNGC